MADGGVAGPLGPRKRSVPTGGSGEAQGERSLKLEFAESQSRGTQGIPVTGGPQPGQCLSDVPQLPVLLFRVVNF